MSNLPRSISADKCITNPTQDRNKLNGLNMRRIRNSIRLRLWRLAEDSRIRGARVEYDISGYSRIYHYHIRKSGGTSINHMFLSMGNEEPCALYHQLSQIPGQRLLRNGRVFVGWNGHHINGGRYFYAFSHQPMHKLELPPNTFTFTCFRDPIKRLISHYNMLMYPTLNNVQYPCMAAEEKWIGSSFDDFLERIPKNHLMNQLWMFSTQYDVAEALENVSGLSHIMFTEDFESGVQGLSIKTGLKLKSVHVRQSQYHARITDTSIGRAREILDKEYRFLAGVKRLGN